ncbi:MAG: ABC transporter permease [Terriglobia bacterium]
MGPFIQDLRYALRMLAKSPGFTAVAVMALALGIGANTAIFSVIDALLLRPLAFDGLDRLVLVWETLPQGGEVDQVPPADFRDWSSQNHVFDHLAAYRWWDVNLTGGGEPERVEGCLVSGSFFATLGVKAALGRTFQAGEGQFGWDPVAVISDRLWQQRFGADPDVIGKTVQLDGRTYTVVGVLPPRLEWPTGVELWAPLALTNEEKTERRQASLLVLGRIRPRYSLSEAQAEVDVIARRLGQLHPETSAGRGAKLLPLPGNDFDNIIRSFLLVLMGGAGFVLLMACANVANLQLARAVGRRKEVGLRAALGATRWRLVRQLLTESIVLSLLGAALGTLVAYLGVNLIRTNVPAEQVKDIPGFYAMQLNGRGLEFTLAVALLTGIISGLVPAIRTSKVDLMKTLKEEGRSSTIGSKPLRLRGFLVAAEFALALMLLVGTGLMVKGFVRMFNSQTQDFDPQNVLTLRIALSRWKYPTPHQKAVFYKQVLDRIATIPEVESDGAANSLPSSGEWDSVVFSIEGHATSVLTEKRHADLEKASGNYFHTLRVPLLKGRDFTAQDEGTAPVAIISASMARRYWPNEDPLGKQIKLGASDSEEPWMTIVGIVADVKQSILSSTPRPTLYVPYPQSPPAVMTLVVRTGVNPLSLISSVRHEILSVDKDQPIFGIKSMEDFVADNVGGIEIATALMGSFGVVALILAAVGIYSVMAYSVSQRTQEFAVRLALGAQRRDIMGLVVGHGLRLAVAGLVVGLPGAFALTRVMSSLVFGVVGLDLPALGGFTLLLLAVATVASYLPAMRATNANPIEALR